MSQPEETAVPKLAIDNDKLGGAIDRQTENMVAHSMQILTRAQLRLQAEVDRKNELQHQVTEDEAQLVDLRSQRDRLIALIEKGEANVRDARIEMHAVLGSIHVLENEGIILPPGIE